MMTGGIPISELSPCQDGCLCLAFSSWVHPVYAHCTLEREGCVLRIAALNSFKTWGIIVLGEHQNDYSTILLACHPRIIHLSSTNQN